MAIALTTPITSPLYLLDGSGNAWLFTVTDSGTGNGILTAPPPLSAVASVTLADTATTQVWALTAVSTGTFPALTITWQLTLSLSTTAAPYILTTSPNGNVFATVVENGQLSNDIATFAQIWYPPVVA